MVDPLLEALDNGTEEEIVRAVCELGRRRIHARAMVPRLHRLVGRDISPHLDSVIATALGRIGSPEAIEPLITIIRRHLHARAASRAASALEKLGTDAVTALPTLFDSRRSKLMFTRSNSSWAIFAIVRACLDEQYEELQLEAVRCLSASRRTQCCKHYVDRFVKGGVTDRVVDAATRVSNSLLGAPG